MDGEAEKVRSEQIAGLTFRKSNFRFKSGGKRREGIGRGVLMNQSGVGTTSESLGCNNILRLS